MAAYNFQCGHAFILPYRPISNHNLLPEAVCKTICLTHPTRCSQQIIFEARCEACIIDEYRASIKLIQAFMQPGDFNAIQSWSIKEEEEDRKLDAIREEEHLFTRAGETWHIDDAKIIFLCMEEQQRFERRLEELQALTEMVVTQTS